MQWMITYGLRPEGTWRGYDENVAGLLATFADWKPPAGVEIVSFVHRADAKGGWMLVESDDVAGPSEIVAQYLAFHDAEIFPGAAGPRHGRATGCDDGLAQGGRRHLNGADLPTSRPAPRHEPGRPSSRSRVSISRATSPAGSGWSAVNFSAPFVVS